jgi:hypothetical protein
MNEARFEPEGDKPAHRELGRCDEPNESVLLFNERGEPVARRLVVRRWSRRAFGRIRVSRFRFGSVRCNFGFMRRRERGGKTVRSGRQQREQRYKYVGDNGGIERTVDPK